MPSAALPSPSGPSPSQTQSSRPPSTAVMPTRVDAAHRDAQLLLSGQVDWLDAWVADNADTLVAWRRDLHAHPELGFDEVRTTGVITAALSAFGLAPRVLPGGTGVICDVGTGEPTVALRADIDALPLTDPKDVPYRSRNGGVCHACGHDAHTAILLGVAGALAAAQDLPGAVRLIFQPAEEQAPGGAPAVVAAGGLDGIERIFALHCDPRLTTGQIGVRVGPITAA